MKLYYYGVKFFKYAEGTDSDHMSDKVYSYQATFKCNIGDLVVAECRDGYKIAKVVADGLEYKEKASVFLICNVTNHVADVNAARNFLFRIAALRKAWKIG